MSITMRELADICGVSTATVSLVLANKDSGRVGAKRREEILRLAKKHGYRSNVAAKGLVTGRTYRIALVIEGALSEHAVLGYFSFYDRLGLLASGLRARGYAIEIIQLEGVDDVAGSLETLTRSSVDGFIFVNWRADQAIKLMRSLKERGLSTAASGTKLGTKEFNWTDVDRGSAFTDAVYRLGEAGHGKIVFIDCHIPKVSQYKKEKREAFLRAVDERLGADGSDWVFIAQEPTYEEIMRMVAEAVRRLPDARAFLLTDNFYADAALHALRLGGLQPGSDCRVIGLGDTVLADRCRPRLSHYTLEIPAQAKFSVETLIEEIESSSKRPPRHRIFAPTYIEQET